MDFVTAGLLLLASLAYAVFAEGYAATAGCAVGFFDWGFAVDLIEGACCLLLINSASYKLASFYRSAETSWLAIAVPVLRRLEG